MKFCLVKVSCRSTTNCRIASHFKEVKLLLMCYIHKHILMLWHVNVSCRSPTNCRNVTCWINLAGSVMFYKYNTNILQLCLVRFHFDQPQIVEIASHFKVIKLWHTFYIHKHILRLCLVSVSCRSPTNCRNITCRIYLDGSVMLYKHNTYILQLYFVRVSCRSTTNLFKESS